MKISPMKIRKNMARKIAIPAALAEGSPPIHGRQRLQDGFDIEEVVSEYNVLRGCIHCLADEHLVNLQGAPLHIINRVFDPTITIEDFAWLSFRCTILPGVRVGRGAVVACGAAQLGE